MMIARQAGIQEEWPYSSPAMHSSPAMPYHSAAMAAELPNIYELPAEQPEMALVGRLLNTGPDREGPGAPVVF